GADIRGATSATYTIPAVQAGNAGSYAVVVSSAGSSITSEAAVLTVTSVVEGASLQFRTAANSLTFSWPAGYSLQTSATLSPAAWTDAPGASPQSFSTA